MELNININMDNSAFDEDKENELARIFKNLADKMQEFGFDSQRSIRDINGNTVGTIEIN